MAFTSARRAQYANRSPVALMDPFNTDQGHLMDEEPGPGFDSYQQPQEVALFNEDDLDRAFAYATSLEDSARNRLESILSRLNELGRFRSFTPAVAPEEVLALKQTFPNFSEVLDEIAAHIALARLAGEDKAPLAFPPILLVGPPGVGKTYFTQQLCETLGAHFNETSLNSNSAGFILSGLDMGWSSGKPGLVFRALMEGPIANPFILLDEIDKANKPDSAHDPLGPLYGLLEPQMAKRFCDEATTLPMDASHILWVATANDVDSIPEPLLSRMTVFEIPFPSVEQTATLAYTVWRKLRQNTAWGPHMHEKISDGIIECLKEKSPRDMTRLFIRAAGRAIMNKRHILNPVDFSIDGTEDSRNTVFRP